MLQKITAFTKNNKAPLIVFLIILGAVLFDYSYRHSDQNFYAKGIESMRAGKPDDAISAFSRALRNNPSDPAARAALGWAYHSKGWVDEAQKQYEMATKAVSETITLSSFNLGLILQNKKKFDAAITEYQKVIALTPDSTGALLNLGFIYADKGQLDTASQYFNRVVHYEPKNTTALFQLGQLNERQGKKADAKKFYKLVLAFDSHFKPAFDRLKALGE